jgi:hypothetical protein
MRRHVTAAGLGAVFFLGLVGSSAEAQTIGVRGALVAGMGEVTERQQPMVAPDSWPVTSAPYVGDANERSSAQGQGGAASDHERADTRGR